MTVIVQQPYNLFAQQKMAGYPSYQDTQKRVPGQVQGETPEQFAAGKQAANSQTGAVSVPVVEQTPAPVVQNTKPQPSDNTKVVTAPMDANSPTAGMDYLNSLYTSPQEEERLRKANVMNQRILAIGDAVRHIGNIANTVNWAPAQQFNSPVQEEQARYEKGKAFRDRANLQYYTYQQQKAAQDAKARQWEAEQKQRAAQWAATFRYNAARDAANLAEKQRQYNETAKRNQEKDKLAAEQWEKAFNQKEKHQKQQMGVQWYNAKTSRMNAERLANGGGNGSLSQPIDTPYGKLRLSGKTHDADQIRQIWGYARDLGLTSQSQIEARLRAMGLGKDDSDTMKRQVVMDLMRTDGRLSKYAAERLGAVFDDGYPTDGVPYASEPKAQPMFQTAWGGPAYAGVNPYDQYKRQNSGTGNVTDYSQYIRKQK